MSALEIFLFSSLFFFVLTGSFEGPWIRLASNKSKEKGKSKKSLFNNSEDRSLWNANLDN